MREQGTQAAEKAKRKWWQPTGPAKIAIAVILTLVLSTGLWCLALGGSGVAMVQAYLLARFAFVETDADLDGATDKALSAFVDGLGDTWSYYLSAEEHQATMERRANNYVGVGITVTYEREEGLLVKSVTKGGPADKAGVLAGDVITAVDGVSMTGEAKQESSERIRGEVGTKVVLTLLREDGTTLDVTCTRDTLHNASAQGRLLDDKVGYVQLSNFYSGSADSFQAEVDALLEQGAESLLIDLRGDPGGYVSELEQILDYLLPEGPVFTHKPRWWFKSVYVSDENCVDLPMAVLVNQHSYSAAELLAAQLRESVDAPIVGERTSGKGYSQLTFPLANGGGAGLSTAAYCTGSGHSLIGEGIVPDVELSLPEGAALGGEDDVQLKAALELLVADGG